MYIFATDMLLLGMVLSFLIPFAIWFALRPWKPKTQISYAAKFALWPTIIFSWYLGYPVARAIFGVKSRYLQDLDQALPAIILWMVVFAPFAFGIGYFIARKKFK